ncbi:MAG: queuosine precursor transporter [Eubacterium sp.]|nr:queuosine precursor transporter [Eubacterium sp.]
MLNTVIFFGAVVFFLFAVIVAFKLFGKAGLFVYVCFATILANIQVCKSIELFGITTTAGAVLYASTFLCTDILSERYGKDDAKKAVWLGVFINILWIAGTQVTLWLTPSTADYINPSLEVVFGMVPRISIASLISYIISQRLDVFLYHIIWNKTGNSKKGLWLRNNGSTLVSQLVDSVMFVTIAFVGTMPANVFLQIMITTYLFKAIVALCDTPFAYLAQRIKTKENSDNEQK